MKRFIITLGLALLLVPAAPGAFTRAQDSMLARVTVYWARGGSGSDRDTRQHKSATGARLRPGHCAVDPRKIAYGSQVVFPDGTAVAAVDTGSAVRSRKAARYAGRTASERSAIVVDRFFETKRQALSWANRNPHFMTVRVVPPNSRGVARPAQQTIVSPTTTVVTKTTTPAVTRPAPVYNSAPVRNPLNRIGR